MLYTLFWLNTWALLLFSAVIAFGSPIITHLLRTFLGPYVGDAISIDWSFIEGWIVIKHLQIQPSILAMLSPYTCLPIDVSTLNMDECRIQLPVWPSLRARNIHLLKIHVQVETFQVGLLWNDPEKWVWSREENDARRKDSVKQAAANRIASANNMTVIASNRLKELNSIRKELKKKGLTAQASKAPSDNSSRPMWQRLIDTVIDAFEMRVNHILLSSNVFQKSQSLGFRVQMFEIGAAARHSDKVTSTETEKLKMDTDQIDFMRQRTIRVVNFAMEVNAQPEKLAEAHLIKPVSLQVVVSMPAVLQGMLFRPDNGIVAPVATDSLLPTFEGEKTVHYAKTCSSSNLNEKSTLSIAITFDNVTLQLRPAQLALLWTLLRPIGLYYDWNQHAQVDDQLSCVDLSPEEQEEYKTLFVAQWDFDQNTNFLRRLYITQTNKEDVTQRKNRINELESRILASSLLYLRSEALQWRVPSGGKPLQFIEPELKKKKDLLKFSSTSTDLREYEPDMPLATPLMDQIELVLCLNRVSMDVLYDGKPSPVLQVFSENVSIAFAMSMRQLQDERISMESHITIKRFGLLDCRNSRTNVFTRLLDRNLECDQMMTLSYTQRASGMMHLDVQLRDFSVLIVFGPLLSVVHLFLPATEEDESTQLRYLETETSKPPMAPEEYLQKTPVYVQEIPQEYSPMLLGGLLLQGIISIKGCELCLVGDSTTLKSHVLALTSDMHIKIAGSKRHEAANLEFADVALQPCSVMIFDDGLSLDMKTGGTIMELEGEGVDLEIGYSLALGTLALSRSQVARDNSMASSTSKTSEKLWKVAQSAAIKKQIVEVDHPEARKLESAIALASREEHKKPQARRKLVLNMSDFALNLSPNDLGVFISILSSLHDSMKEDQAVVSERHERQHRVDQARKRLEEDRYMERLKKAFDARDVDKGGSLDADEVRSLLQSVTNCNQLTKDEFEATVRDFISIVDRDQSGDISSEEFGAALSREKIAYASLHYGVVTLTGGEYVHPDFQRRHVPYPIDEEQAQVSQHAKTFANITALKAFWDTYTTQTNCSESSLNGQSAITVQKKMVRIFKNYEYAQEAWRRLVNPALVRPGERSDWLLIKEMEMGGRTNVIDELLSSFDDKDDLKAADLQIDNLVPENAKRMFIKTMISTSFGGFYFRLIDDMLPLGTPAMEVSLEELAMYGNLCMWEGDLSAGQDAPTLGSSSRAHAHNYGVGRLSFDVYAKYYNINARQVEPFLEYYHGTLDVCKQVEASTELLYTSDRYFQLNLTSAFVHVVNTTLASFYSIEKVKERQRSHIKEEGGLFWMLNESGMLLKYYVVVEKRNQDVKVPATTSKQTEIVSQLAVVPPDGAHACKLLKVEEDHKAYEQQNMKEKYLRQAFRNADIDGSGELEASEVRNVLRQVFENDETGGASMFARGRTVSKDDFEGDLTRAVDDFMALADTDMSGQVSWEEFKVAIAKSRAIADRYISLEIEGFQPIHKIPLVAVGQTQVYELTKRFEDIENELAIEKLYREGVMLLVSLEDPSKSDLERAFACLHRVKELDPSYEWIDSYYQECRRLYLPLLVAVNIVIDHFSGLQVCVSGAGSIRNGTAKETQCILYDENGQIASRNTHQRDENPLSLFDADISNENGGIDERYCVLPPHGELCIPLNLAEVGSFAIRQIGETEWSNRLPLSVKEQRLYKQFTSFEQKEVQKAQRGQGRPAVKSADRIARAMGDTMIAPSTAEVVQASGQIGTERTYPSSAIIDDQPTVVVEKAAFNDSRLGTWLIQIQPQLLMENVLPCAIEYAIVQPRDCPEDVLDRHKQFRSGAIHFAKSDASSNPIDYFSYVTQVNARRMYLESGQNMEVFGLDLEQTALMKIRLCANTIEPAKKSSWSAPLLIHLDAMRHNTCASAANTKEIELRMAQGPGIVVRFQNEEREHPRRVVMYAPFWIQNRCGLDLEYHIHKGYSCSTEDHRTYFGSGDKAMGIPIMATGPLARSMLTVKPYRETPPAFEQDLPESARIKAVKKVSPRFDKVGWSEACDISNVGTVGEVHSNASSGSSSFVLAFEVQAAPRQFFRSKICILSPRYVLISRVPRRLDAMPLMLDKRRKRSHTHFSRKEQQSIVSLDKDEALQVYRFVGPEKVHAGIQLRDAMIDTLWKDLGPWSPPIPWAVDVSEVNFWTRGPLEDAPACSVSFRNTQETLYAVVEDISKTPRYRIENRSTRHAIRYFQAGVRDVDEMILSPLMAHSYVWSDPFVSELKLRMYPSKWKIPTDVDFMQIGVVKGMTMENLYGEVYIDGTTRVFAVGDTMSYNLVRQKAIFDDWLTDLLIDFALHGVGMSIVDSVPREVLNFTMETIRMESKAGTRALCVSLHHIQIDDMTSTAQYPVVLAPLDSGFNSDKMEGWMPEDGERPFFTLKVVTAPQTGLPIIDDFDMELHSIKANINLEYVITVGNLLASFIPGNDEATKLQYGIDEKNAKLDLTLGYPEPINTQGLLMYFRHWRLSAFNFHLVFDSVQEERGEGISYFLGSTLGSIIGGIAHVTPDISFSELVYENRFFYEYDLMYAVIWSIVYSVLGQWYKIVGSVEFLGDPVGLATDIVDGFALAARQLKRDVRGKSRRKGESALILAQTVVGAPSKSIGKVSNGLGDLLKKATRFQSQEEPEEPRHVPEGILQGGIVFTKSLAHGVSGFVGQPVRGARENGFKGFAKGMGFGTLQLVACPIVGTLGAVEKFSQSVNNTTHLLDEKEYDGTRRPARNLSENPLKPLSDSVVITQVEMHVLSVEGLGPHSNPQVVIKVFEEMNDTNESDSFLRTSSSNIELSCVSTERQVRQVGEYKTSTLHHTGDPKFDQSWLISIGSASTHFEIIVYHKRKPLPKKRLGVLHLRMDDIYRDFDEVPAKVLQDAKARLNMKKRKRYPGSILKELALHSGASLEMRDDHWRQRLKKTTAASVFQDESEQEDEQGDDDYVRGMQTLRETGDTASVQLSLDPKPIAFDLIDSDSHAKIYLSVRYVNDLRR
ncbi:unnamed protein product [Albugo candida]|uniref:Uncharacterized protein n=1 Tax=Albugo candida TaxID=65357 RepID=A0A024G8R6_9STRA|nr:unnamed protein product [Albugo candida]|eukprot:CCI43266.1 unnamed protein product [Albugo candida]